MTFPVVLHGAIESLAPSIAGGLADARGLQNRTDRILRICEIRYHLANAAVPSVTSGSEFSTTDVQLRIGNEPITAGFTPISAMTWPMDDSFGQEELSPGTWMTRIPASRPVLLAPGERITMQAIHFGAAAIYIRVIALCEPVDSVSPSFLPWFAFYKPPARLDGSGDYEDTSTEADLVNPFDSPIAIERLIGRVFANGSSVGIGGGGSRLLFDAIRMRMEDHEATQIVRDAAPLSSVIDRLSRTWQVETTLASKGFYRVTIESRLSTQIMQLATPIQAIIGMVGYRRVK